MATKRIKDLTNTATEADLVSGNYLAIDGGAGTKKLPGSAFAKAKYGVDKINALPEASDEDMADEASAIVVKTPAGPKKYPVEKVPTGGSISEAVSDWLFANPEYTTTVEDGSLTEPKFSDPLKLLTIKDYVTPEMFGAKGDNSTDDSAAIQAAINSGKPVYIPRKTYKIETPLEVKDRTTIFGSGMGSIIHAVGCNAIICTESRLGVHLFDFRLAGDLLSESPTLSRGISFEYSMAKCVISNMHISQFGAWGIYLDDSWDYEIADVNVSQNQNGLYANEFNSSSLHKVVAWKNVELGVVIEASAQARVSGTIQENGKTGLLMKACYACDVSVYGEQNGFTGSSNEEKSQIVLTNGGPYGESTSCSHVKFYLLGGQGSDMESSYGIYLNWAVNNNIEGLSLRHTVKDLYETSNSTNNIIININSNVQAQKTAANVDLLNEKKTKAEIHVHDTSTIANYCVVGENTSASSINFGVTFDSVPSILLTPLNTSAQVTWTVVSRSTAGFTFKCYAMDGTERTDIYFSWMAIGPKS